MKLRHMLSFPLLFQWNHESNGHAFLNYTRIAGGELQRFIFWLSFYGGKNFREIIFEKYEHRIENKFGPCVLQKSWKVAFWTIVRKLGSGRHTGIPGFWTKDLDAGLWTRDSGRWTLDAGLWTLDATLRKLGSGQ